MKIKDLRKDYTKGELNENELAANPLDQFRRWFKEALTLTSEEPNAMTLSTLRSDGFPTSRIVLLKDLSDKGFSFYTNYNSDKAAEIEANPKVSLNFLWHALEKQVRIIGICEKLPESESQEYFASRPRPSQIGAWVSPQSEAIPGRDFLLNRLKEIEKQYENKEVPRPAHWGGYRVMPVEIEFWQGRSGRLHDRILYKKENDNWRFERLAP